MTLDLNAWNDLLLDHQYCSNSYLKINCLSITLELENSWPIPLNDRWVKLIAYSLGM